jgi:hypothetical protein
VRRRDKLPTQRRRQRRARVEIIVDIIIRIFVHTISILTTMTIATSSAIAISITITIGTAISIATSIPTTNTIITFSSHRTFGRQRLRVQPRRLVAQRDQHALSSDCLFGRPRAPREEREAAVTHGRVECGEVRCERVVNADKRGGGVGVGGSGMRVGVGENDG